MDPDILVAFCTYDRLGVLKPSLETMMQDPGLPFRLWVIDNGSAFTNMYSSTSGLEHLDFLVRWYKQGNIERLILNHTQQGIYFSFNVLIALAQLRSDNPRVEIPEFIFLTCDDMLYEPGWLAECHRTLLDCEAYPKGKVVVVSPFHCQHSDGVGVPCMGTVDTFEIGERTYEIKHRVSGNTWFMRASTWLDFMGPYPVAHPYRQGDWTQLQKLHEAGFFCAVTPKESVHHNVEATGHRAYDRIHNFK
jgi:glycosyltransferase involved in cell wall biosynthesis